MDINFDSLKVNDQGQVRFSGLGSGIDFVGAVDSIIKARRIPVDRMEKTVEANTDKIAAFQALQSRLLVFQDSLNTLRGAVSLGGSGNIFAAKQPFASTSRTDAQPPSSPSSLIGITTTNAATIGNHEVEILQTARSHRIASQSFGSTSSGLGFADGDSFTIEGRAIEVNSQDTLLSLRDKINAANTGSAKSGVSASIISAGSSAHYLVLTKDTPGSSIAIEETAGTPLQTAGLLNAGGEPANTLQTARKALLHADGLLDTSNTAYETERLSGGGLTLGSSGTLRFQNGSTTVDLAYTSGQTVSGLASAINDDIDLQAMGISAALIQEGGQVRLKITSGDVPFTISEQGGGAVLGQLGLDNARLLISRDTNTIDDLYAGVTLSLFQAEVGTRISIDIEQDLSAVKQQISGFVEAYNDLKSFMNEQTQINDATGKPRDEALLFGDPSLTAVRSRIDQLLGTGVSGVAPTFSVLAQIGITLVGTSGLSDPLLANTLTINQNKLNESLLNAPDDVRRLFAFDFSSSNPNLVLLGFNGNTAFNPDGFTVNVAFNELYQGDALAQTGSMATSEAVAGGAEAFGISNLALLDSLASGGAYRYAYDATTETLTLFNLATGHSESVAIGALIDAEAGAGLNLAAGQTVDVLFEDFGTITLSGDLGFDRFSAIAAGAVDTAGLDSLAFTGATLSPSTSGMTQAAIDALAASGAFDPITGRLTLTFDGSSAGEAYLQPAAGLRFSLDGGPVSSDLSAINLDDGLAHELTIFVDVDGSDVAVGTLNFTALDNAVAGGGAQTMTLDLATGLFGSTSTVVSASAAMGNFLDIGDGAFEIRDPQGLLLASIAYSSTDSLTELAAQVNAILGLSATLIDEDGAIRLQITHDESTPLSFTGDSGGLVAALNLINRGTQVVSANVGGSADGADNGTISIANNILTFTSATEAHGLRLLYTGNSDASGIEIGYTVGLGAQMFHAADNLLNEDTGAIANAIESLDATNTQTEERIAVLLERLERQRQSMMQRFIAMETALMRLNSLREQLTQAFEAMFQQRR